MTLEPKRAQSSSADSEPSPAQTVAALELNGVSVAYAKIPAVSGITFAAPPHSITAIVGPSGSGKSSLLAALNRLTDLIPGATVGGRATLGSLDLLHPRTDAVAVRRRLGMIFQRPHPFPFSIRTNLTLALRERGLRDRRQLEGRIETALRDVGLFDEVKDRLDRPATSLSGGQQQRLCLARALALDPEVLLLDEPCSALDPFASGLVEDLILRLAPRVTTLIVTHHLAQARRIADRVVVLWNDGGTGRLVEHGPTEQIFEQPTHPLTRDYIRGLRG